MADPKQVQIRNMDPDVWRKLKVMAATNGVSMSQLAQNIIREFIEKYAHITVKT